MSQNGISIVYKTSTVGILSLSFFHIPRDLSKLVDLMPKKFYIWIIILLKKCFRI